MKRLPIVAGNWKMNGTLQEADTLTQAIVKEFHCPQEVEVLLCPPFTALSLVGGLTKGSSVGLGAQNMHWEAKGAYTGEISAGMLKEIGCRYVILGHSERRIHFGETDALIHRKILSALKNSLRVILCVGETLEQRQTGRTWEVVKTQLQAGLDGVEPVHFSEQVVIAYEPVWAIGTGQNATPAQAQDLHHSIRSWLAEKFGKVSAEATRIQYGGSVKADNAGELMIQPDVDGALIGGDSLDPKGFISIIESTRQAKKGTRCYTGSS